MNRNRLARVSHPPFAPNIALSDFSLFDKVETVLIGRTLNDENALFHCVMDVLNGFSGHELEAVL
jgi:hypothetical protein